MRRLGAALRRLTQEDDNQHGQQPGQTGPHYQGNVPQPFPHTGVLPLPGPPPGYFPPPGTLRYGGLPPTSGFGPLQPPQPQYQHHPGFAGPASGDPQPVRTYQPTMPIQPGTAPHQVVVRSTVTGAQPGVSTSSASNGEAGSLRPATRLEPPAVYCRWCDKCKRGMAYGTFSFMCIDCTYWLCPGCNELHRRVHKQSARVELTRWGAATPKFITEAVNLCHACAPQKEVRAQIRCKHCPYALCLSCGHNDASRTMFHVGHGVRHMMLRKPTNYELLAVYPEGWFVTEMRGAQPCPCQERPATAIIHCQRCYLLIEIGQQVQWCRGCFSDWGINQWLCGTCFQEDLKRDVQTGHKHKHDFVKALIMDTPNEPNETKDTLWCQPCEMWLSTSDDRGTHFHDHVNANTDIMKRQPYLIWKISPRFLEMRRLTNYKTCNMDRTFTGSVQHTGN